MSNNNYGYGDHYPPPDNRTQNPQPSQQGGLSQQGSYSTSNATGTGPYYGLQPSTAPARTYPNTDYQYQQYPQQTGSNNGGSYNWDIYSASKAAAASTTDSLSNLAIPEQRSNNTTKPSTQSSSYNTGSLGNLAYASTLNYGSVGETAQQTADYSGANIYGGGMQGSGNVAVQRNASHQVDNHTRKDSTSSRPSQAAGMQRLSRAPEQLPNANSATAFSLPSPSSTYPQTLINTYPKASANTVIPRTSISSISRAPSTTDTSRNLQQIPYTPSYNYSLSQKSENVASTQMRKSQTPTPPVPPIPRSTASINSNTAYPSHPSQPQSIHNPNNQSSMAYQSRAQPAASLSPTKMPVNVIRRTGDAPIVAQQNRRSLSKPYQPAPLITPTSQKTPTSNYLPQPLHVAPEYQQPQQQQPAASQRQPSPGRPTTVDPSHVYNRYHEYQKQIEAAEAEAEVEAARLAKLKEEQDAAEAARLAKLKEEQDAAEAARLAKLKEEQDAAEAARLAKLKEEQNVAEAAARAAAAEAVAAEQLRQESFTAQQERYAMEATEAAEAAKTLAQAMAANNAAKSEPTPEEDEEGYDEEEEEQADDDGNSDYVDENSDYEDEQQAPANNSSEEVSRTTAVATRPETSLLNGPPRSSARMESQPLSKDGPVDSMEEEMRNMIEKLRDYQSKDPKLFLQVWSSARKTNAAQPPQSQAEESQAQGSPSARPAEVPLQNPSPNIPQSEPIPNGFAPAPATPSVSKSATLSSPGSTRPRSLSPNSKRRAKGPSRSKAAIVDRAAARAAKFAAFGASMPTTPEPALIASRNPSVAQYSYGNSTSTAQASVVLPTTQAPILAPAGQTTAVAINSLSVANAQSQNGATQPNSTSSQRGGPVPYPKQTGNPPPQQGANWPSAQRDLIASTAAEVLNSIPENAGKHMEPLQVRAMLERNPSYVELCEMIEKMGFRMDRARFAKTLLGIIPNANSRTQAPSAGFQPSSARSPNNTAEGTVTYLASPVPQIRPSSGGGQGAAQLRTLQPASTSVIVTVPAGPGSGPPPSTPGIPARLQAGHALSSTPSNLGPYLGRLIIDVQPSHVTVPRPSLGRRGPGRPRKDGQPPHRELVVTTPAKSAAAYPLQTPSATATAPTTNPPPITTVDYLSPYAGSQPPGLESSAQASNQEVHQMSLLQAFVGRQSNTGTNSASVPTAHSSLYQRQNQPAQNQPAQNQRAQNQPASTGTAAASNNQNVALVQHMARSYQEFWSSQQPAHQPAQHQAQHQAQQHAQHQAQQQSQQHQPQYQPQNSNTATTTPRPIFPRHYYPSASASDQSRPPGLPLGPSQVNAHAATNQAPNVYNATIKPSITKPLTKEAAARKRTFAEILDLTINTTSDPYGEPQAKNRRIVNRINNFSAVHGPQTLEAPSPRPQSQIYQKSFANQPHNIGSQPSAPQLEVARNPLLEYDGIVKAIDRFTALRRSQYNPKTIARDILISAGRHKSQRCLNAHLEQLKERFVKVNRSSDLSTFRWDIVDPGGLSAGSENMEAAPGSGNSDSMASASSNFPMRGPLRPSRGGSHSFALRGIPRSPYDPVPSRPSGLRNETSNDSDFALLLHNSPSEPKRRGRPPRDPNAPPKIATPKRPMGRPRKNPIDTTPASAPRPTFNEHSNPIKRRRVAPKDALKSVSRLSTPRYQPFSCEWKGCKAELQNLETLRRHVYGVHGKASVEGEVTCLWGACGNQVINLESGDEHGEVEKQVFNAADAFGAHVERAHLVPIAWHMGDGPKGSTLDGNESDRSSYLRDGTGHLVTPSIHDQAIEGGKAAHRNARWATESSARAAPKFSQWDYWCGPGHRARPAIREGDFPSRYANVDWYDPNVAVEDEYGDELRRAAKASQGPAEAVPVYSKDMPDAVRRQLGID